MAHGGSRTVIATAAAGILPLLFGTHQIEDNRRNNRQDNQTYYDRTPILSQKLKHPK